MLVLDYIKGVKPEDVQRFEAIGSNFKRFLCSLFLWSKKSLDASPMSLPFFITIDLGKLAPFGAFYILLEYLDCALFL